MESCCFRIWKLDHLVITFPQTLFAMWVRQDSLLKPMFFRTWRTRSWRPTCGWSSSGGTTSSSGTRWSTAGCASSTCPATTSGGLTSCSTTSESRPRGSFCHRICGLFRKIAQLICKKLIFFAQNALSNIFLFNILENIQNILSHYSWAMIEDHE